MVGFTFVAEINARKVSRGQDLRFVGTHMYMLRAIRATGRHATVAQRVDDQKFEGKKWTFDPS